jgi:hypothetical protein
MFSLVKIRAGKMARRGGARSNREWRKLRRASKIREAVVAPGAFPTWSKQSAICGGRFCIAQPKCWKPRRPELQNELARAIGTQASTSAAEVTAAIDRLVYYGDDRQIRPDFRPVNPAGEFAFLIFTYA